jgi:hypothetical protein
MDKLKAFPIIPIAVGALLCGAGIGVLYKADALTVRLMRATGADVLARDGTSPPKSFVARGEGEETVQRVARWALPVHALGLCLLGLGAWLQVRALRPCEGPSLDEHTQRLLAEWVLMRAALQHRLTAGVTPSSHDAIALKVLDYLVARYSVPGPARGLAAPPRRADSAATESPVSLLLRHFRGARKQPKGSAAFRPALEEIRHLNVESYAGFGFSRERLRTANYN